MAIAPGWPFPEIPLKRYNDSFCPNLSFISKNYFMQEVTSPSPLAMAQKNMRDYLRSHDARYVTDDAVFINKATGERITGRPAIGKMLQFFYHIAFDAHAETTHVLVTEDKAFAEGLFMGKHIGEFAGIPATGKIVSVPLCVTYTLENSLIKEARIYMMMDALMKQLQS
jgi:predicted ester cyclase